MQSRILLSCISNNISLLNELLLSQNCRFVPDETVYGIGRPIFTNITSGVSC